MKISDLSYLKVVSESSFVGGDNANNASSFQLTSTNINGNKQVSEKSSGAPYKKTVLPDGRTVYAFGNSTLILPTSLVQ